MKADSKKIEWLLKNETQYRIAKETGVSQSILSRLVTGKREVKGLSLELASKLTEYADRLMEEKKSQK